jgi:prolipoprotein diacylglyceryltransferase
MMMALAIFAAGAVVTKEFKRSGFNEDTGWRAVVWGALGGVVGARLW